MGGQVLRYDLVLTRIVVQLIKGREEGSTEGVPGGRKGKETQETGVGVWISSERHLCSEKGNI